MAFLAAEIIKKKRSGVALKQDEIEFMVNGYASGHLPDYQMAAWLMAVLFRDMDETETWALTNAMMRSGRMLDFSRLGFSVDKHSTGGVGDKTSLILGPIVASLGVPVPMIAGRGLGHTGGTIDKLESIPGFTCDIGIAAFEKQVEQFGLSMMGQTAEICPADKKIYALRDVTATVESYPLICASIMSKKIAEGIQGLVLDVKFGSGAFMKSIDDARELARRLCRIGELGGKRVTAVLTDMNQPLGRFIGNSLEIEEVLAVLRQTECRNVPLSEFNDCQELSLKLAGIMLALAGRAASFEAGYELSRSALLSGKALAYFEEFVHLQRGTLAALPTALLRSEVVAQHGGLVTSINTEQVGYASVLLGAGRLKTGDAIHPLAGIEVKIRVGDRVQKGDCLYVIYGSKMEPSNQQIEAAKDRLLRATHIKPTASEDLHSSPTLAKTEAGAVEEILGWRPT